MTFDPLAPGPRADPPARRQDSAAWRALAAALRQAAGAVEDIAQTEIAAPTWRPGLGEAGAAFAEGRKDLWRELLRLMEDHA